MIRSPDFQYHTVGFDHDCLSVKVWPEFALGTEIADVPDHDLSTVLDASEQNPDVVYFPGTFHAQVDGYQHNTLPIVSEGRILHRRRKIASNYRVYNWTEAATALGLDEEAARIADAVRTLEDPTATDMSRGEASNIADVLYTGPKGRIQEKVRERARTEATTSVKSVRRNGVEILPVICNEIRHLSEHVDSEPDIVVEVAYVFDEWRRRYRELVDDGVLGPGTYIVRADGGCPDESGVYVTDRNKLTPLPSSHS